MSDDNDEATNDLCAEVSHCAVHLAEYETPDPDAKRVADELSSLLVDVAQLCDSYELASVAQLVGNLRRRLVASAESGSEAT